ACGARDRPTRARQREPGRDQRLPRAGLAAPAPRPRVRRLQGLAPDVPVPDVGRRRTVLGVRVRGGCDRGARVQRLRPVPGREGGRDQRGRLPRARAGGGRGRAGDLARYRLHDAHRLPGLDHRGGCAAAHGLRATRPDHGFLGLRRACGVRDLRAPLQHQAPVEGRGASVRAEGREGGTVMDKIAVIGAGSWGTTLANLLAKKGHPVTLWAYEPEVASAIEEHRENPQFLPGIALDARLRATSDLAEAVPGADVIVVVSPSQHVRRVMGEAARYVPDRALIVSASKGIETTTLKTMAEVLSETLPGGERRTCFLSGPSFALEVAQEQPTAVTVAAEDEAVARRAQELFQTDYFRVYTTDDVRGVELGGALKNVIALAAGMVVGLGFGHNTMAALITRGLAEITRLGIALGARPLTFAGLAGMG